MLEIIVNFKKVDLKKDIQIPLVIENPFMLEDRIPLPYSFAFELPATPTNLEIFGYPNRIGSYKNMDAGQSFGCVIHFNGLKIAHGQIKITSFQTDISVQFLGFDVNEDLKKKMYEYDLGREVFAGNYNTFDFNDPSNFASNYKAWAKDASMGLNDKLVVAPLAFKQLEQLDRIRSIIDYTSSTFPFHYSFVPYNRNVFLHSGYILPHIHQDYAWINMYNPSNDSFVQTGSSSQDVTLAHPNVFPLFRVGWVLSKYFKSNLYSNPFISGKLKDLVIPTSYFPKWVRRNYRMTPYSPNQATAPMTSNLKWKNSAGDEIPPNEMYVNVFAKYDEQPYIDYAEFLPDVNVNDFLKEILNTFSFHLVLSKGNFGIKTSNDILSNPVKVDWSNKLIGRPELFVTPGKAYFFNYANQLEANIGDPSSYGQLNTLYELAAINLDPDEDEDDIRTYYVKETNGYYKLTGILSKFGRSNETNNPSDDEILLTIEYLGEKPVEEQVETKEPQKNEVAIIKPPQVPGPHFITLDRVAPGYPETYFYKIPLIEGNRKKRPNTVSILYFEGEKPINKKINGVQKNYPSVTTKSNDFSLEWDGDQGLLENYHSAFKSWVEKDKLKLTGVFLINHLDLQNLDITDKVHINGRNFFIQKIQVTIRYDRIDPSLVELLEA